MRGDSTVMWQEIQIYLSALATDVAASPNTIAAYRNDLTQFYQYLVTAGADAMADGAGVGGGWSAISRIKVVGFVVSLKEKGYAVTTVARKIAAVKSFFHFL